MIGPSLNRTGYVHEVKSVLSEFMQYGIGPKELETLTEYANGRGGLYHKLQDLGVIYQGFREYMEKGYVTAEETLGLLAERLFQSRLVRGAVVAVDGFVDFHAGAEAGAAGRLHDGAGAGGHRDRSGGRTGEL